MRHTRGFAYSNATYRRGRYAVKARAIKLSQLAKQINFDGRYKRCGQRRSKRLLTYGVVPEMVVRSGRGKETEELGGMLRHFCVHCFERSSSFSVKWNKNRDKSGRAQRPNREPEDRFHCDCRNRLLKHHAFVWTLASCTRELASCRTHAWRFMYDWGVPNLIPSFDI